MSLQNYLSRVYYWYFDREKVLQSLRTRKGKCNQCGRCCHFFGIRCPFLNQQNLCSIYRFRPKVLCQIPPLNLTRDDLAKNKACKCSYYWDKK